MKTHTSEKQTLDLIKLGFKEPTGGVYYPTPDYSRDTTIQSFRKAYALEEIYKLLENFASFSIRYVYTKKAYIASGSALANSGLAYRGCYHVEQIDALVEILIGLKKRVSYDTNKV